MKKALLAMIAFAVLTLTAAAQKIEKPTLTPTPCTDSQKTSISEGVAFHEAKRYEEAAAKYQSVISENPGCTIALYELSFTYYTMGQKTKAMETAYKGSKYKSDELPLFYLTIANVIDDVGKPDEAVKIYRDAIKILEGDKDTERYLSSLHYNLGVTLSKQKKYDEARAELKKAVEYNHLYASPHYLLSIVYNGTKYKVPAFLAAARFISLEYNSQRTKVAATMIRDILSPASSDEKGNINIILDMNAPKDEGDFGMIEMLLGTLTTVRGKDDEKKTDAEMFVDAVGTAISLALETKNVKSTFVGKNYVPYFTELKKRGFSEVLGYLVLYHTSNASATAWLEKNEAKLREFVTWSKSYTPTS